MKKMMLLLLIAGCAKAADDSMDGSTAHKSSHKKPVSKIEETEKSFAKQPQQEECNDEHKQSKKILKDQHIHTGIKELTCVSCKKNFQTTRNIKLCASCDLATAIASMSCPIDYMV